MVNLNITLPKDFFKEEYIEEYDYIITEFQKEIWAVELDIAAQISKICKKYNLKLYADGGTQLGCVRHNNSFIPWDDDIDFAMTRKDYDIFRKVARQELKEPYVFQDTSTDRVKFHSLKIRRSDTTAIPKRILDKKILSNYGIFVDIFPLDVVPENDCSRDNFKKVLQKINMTTQHHSSKIKTWFNYYNAQRLAFNKSKSQRLANLSFPRDINVYKEIYQYEQATPVKFCGLIDIYLPKDSEKTLESQYQNWRTPVIGASKHRGTLFNTSISYKDIIKNLDKLIINDDIHSLDVNDYEYY